MTAQLGCAIEDIVYDEELTDLEKLEAFAAFLEENVSQFVQFGKTARELLAKELNIGHLLDPREPLHSQTSQSFIHPNNVDSQLLDEPGIRGSGIFDDLFAALYREKCRKPLKVRALDLDKRMTTNLTDSAHLRSVFGGALSEEGEGEMREPVTKQDFLLVRLQKFDDLTKQFRYTPEERLALAKRFRSSTDQILSMAGLPKLYVANPLDHMVLTALCQEDPIGFTQELFYQAAREERL